MPRARQHHSPTDCTIGDDYAGTGAGDNTNRAIHTVGFQMGVIYEMKRR